MHKTIETQTTDFVFCDFGIYRGILFIEPNQTIKLQLPPREKSLPNRKTLISNRFRFGLPPKINNNSTTKFLILLHN
ncbi:MAG: hypothetical protein IPF54_12610 [Draconibacterium sp.]|nr:hypothetical protein [Draconibacterium sp.]